MATSWRINDVWAPTWKATVDCAPETTNKVFATVKRYPLGSAIISLSARNSSASTAQWNRDIDKCSITDRRPRSSNMSCYGIARCVNKTDPRYWYHKNLDTIGIWEAELSGTGSRSGVEFWFLRVLVLPLHLLNNDMVIEESTSLLPITSAIMLCYVACLGIWHMTKRFDLTLQLTESNVWPIPTVRFTIRYVTGRQSGRLWLQGWSLLTSVIITNHQPLFYMHHLICGISSLLRSVKLSTSFCSLSSWFISPCTTGPFFAITIYHSSSH